MVIHNKNVVAVLLRLFYLREHPLNLTLGIAVTFWCTVVIHTEKPKSFFELYAVGKRLLVLGNGSVPAEIRIQLAKLRTRRRRCG